VELITYLHGDNFEFYRSCKPSSFSFTFAISLNIYSFYYSNTMVMHVSNLRIGFQDEHLKGFLKNMALCRPPKWSAIVCASTIFRLSFTGS
jgi:hypothetical protein